MRNGIGFAVCALIVGATMATHGWIDIACDYPGGNIKVEKIDEAAGMVKLAPDLRDTKGKWFYFDFTVRGAAGRKLHFQFPDDKSAYLATLDPTPQRKERVATFRRLWAEEQKGKALVYDGRHDAIGPKKKAAASAKARKPGPQKARTWVDSLPNCWLSVCGEFGYSLCGGVFSQDGGRELGHGLLKSLVRTCSPL